MDMVVDLSIFRSAGVMEILLYLLDKDEGRRKVEIRMDLNLNPTTATKAHRILEKSGFLQGMTYENVTAYALTPEGKRVVRALSKFVAEYEKMISSPEFEPGMFYFVIINKKYKPKRLQNEDL